MWIFSDNMAYFGFVMLYTVLAASGLNRVVDLELQQNLAAALVTLGISISFLFGLPALALYAFAPFFLIKLILGFAVQRPSFLSAVD
jgi:hypothetical protein